MRYAAFLVIAVLAPIAQGEIAPRSLWVNQFNVLVRNDDGVRTDAINSAAGGLGGIDFGIDGFLYGVSAFSDRLIRVDTVTREVTNIGDLGLNFFEGDIGFDPRNGRLYGVGSVTNAGFSSFFSIDLITGVASDVEPLPFMTRNTDGLAIDANGVAWVIDNGSPPGSGPQQNTILHRIDLDTNTLLGSTDLGENLGFTGGLDFDPRTGELFYAAGDGRVFLIDTDTLTHELAFYADVTPLDPVTIGGLAIIPAPSGALLLALAGLSATRRRR